MSFIASIKSNLFSGFFVSMLALPLCLGIAVASGFPPVAGLLTAIVGGFITTAISGAPLTIKGPAAGLIVIVLGAVSELQIPGDPLSGYKRALAIAVVAGLIQILLSRAKFSRIVDLIPTSVIHGMLAAIGVIVIAKQLPILMGTTPLKDLSPLESFMHIPTYLGRENPVLLAIGIATLAAMWCTPT